MKALFTLFATILCSVSLYAQGWSFDPSIPTVITNGPGEQVMPKVAIDSAGNSYITHFDNSSGNYNVWIKKLDPFGNHQFDPPTGYLISNHPANTWLTDYDLYVDQEDNALVTFQDMRNVSNNVMVYKIGPTAAMQWGLNGIALSSDTNTEYANYSPKILNTTDNSTYVAWMRTGAVNGEIRMQRLNSAGQIQWQANGISFAPTTGSYSWPQMIESTDGNILVKYYLDTGPTWSPTRHIYVMKLSPQGTILWNNPIATTGGISAWNQIIGYEPDGSGGAVLAWYDDRNGDNINEIYVSRITDSGLVTTEPNGSLITANTGNQQFYPVIAVQPEQENIYVFYKFTDPAQNNTGLAAQRLNYSGARLWGDSGIICEVISAYVTNPHYAAMMDQGVICVYDYGTEPSSDTNQQLRATCYRATGVYAWSRNFQLMASNNTPKLHFDFDNYGENWIVGIWEEGLSGYDIYAMRMNSNGSVGVFFPAPTNLTATQVGDGFLLEWTAPDIALVPTNYVITLNDTEHIFVPGTVTNYTLTDLPVSTYDIFVAGLFSGGHYTGHSNTVTITIVANEDETIPVVTERLQICPNPIRQQAMVKWYNEQPAVAEFAVYNLKGQKLESRKLTDMAKGWNETTWNCSAYASGIYLLRLETAKGSFSKKVVIQN